MIDIPSTRPRPPTLGELPSRPQTAEYGKSVYFEDLNRYDSAITCSSDGLRELREAEAHAAQTRAAVDASPAQPRSQKWRQALLMTW